MVFRLISIVIGMGLLAGCGNGQKKEAGKKPERSFKIAEIPVALVDQGERTVYIAGHYWDHFNFKDTAYIHLPQVTEQAFVGFLTLLKYVPLPLATHSIQKMLGKAEVDSTMYHYFRELYEKYLYDPNSPVRNEEFYISVLESVVHSPQVSELNKVRPRYQLEMALKNRKGTPAVDFVYTLASGKSGRLSDLKAEWLLLYIQNPDCDACRDTRAALINSSVISELVRSKRLKIVSFYPDEDLSVWRKYVPEMPEEWINGYDKNLSMRNEQLYDLKAIPTLYLLDKDKRVVLKDVAFPELEAYLSPEV